MPELPEVETIARQLAPLLKSQKLIKLTVYDAKLRVFSSGLFDGKRLLQVRRSGKEILFSFSGNLWLKIHLRMTGRLIWLEGNKRLDSNSILLRENFEGLDIRPKSIRAELDFEGGKLIFEDVRRFGTFKAITTKKDLSTTGVDPVSKEFQVPILQELLRKANQPIKVWLLRQDKIVGIGNIYASEVLYRSCINPNRLGSSLTLLEIKRLHAAIVFVLNKAIELSGTTFSDYRDSEGKKGGFQNFLKVYNKENQKCKKCKNEIVCIKQAQRSTYFCLRCQK